MNIANERRLAARATALGVSADAAAFAELAGLARSDSALVRRLAASALGKLAGIVPATETVAVLSSLLRDSHPQVRQYAAKALGAFGTAAESALPDLRDRYRNPDEKEYVKRSVLTAGKTIREASRIAERQAVHHCQPKLWRRSAWSSATTTVFASSKATPSARIFTCRNWISTSNTGAWRTTSTTASACRKNKSSTSKRLLSLYPNDKPRLRDVLREKLKCFLIPAAPV